MKTLESVQITVRGIVQGVGFRPFVYGLATQHGLNGWVYNTSEDVRIEVEGEPQRIEQFCFNLKAKAPPLARIEELTVTHTQPSGYTAFEIRHSVAEEGKYQLISPDIAMCKDCLSELLNPSDRRYRYPFTNCTNCGPRFTIIEDMPYDRPKTTMRSFIMCPECQEEYDNPLDRRFHAQPNACPTCGPQVQLLDSQGSPVPASESYPDVPARAAQLFRKGNILAIKGLGGFLLACDATNESTVKTLRERKRRPSKPFAIMVADIDEARQHCVVGPKEEEVLRSPQSPIVLLKWRESLLNPPFIKGETEGLSGISPAVAPNLKYLGVMLPYTPLHHLLIRDTGLPLVMTSGNLSEEPIAKDNDEALERLAGIADYFLVHNRDIYSRYDDSVAMVEREQIQLVRRARSYAPFPITLPFEARQALGCGAEMKNTFCLTRDNYAFLSQHIGDLENIEALDHFDNTISLYKRLFRVEPEIIGYDLHPEYLATKYAQDLRESGVKLVPVQHHHAHIVSCMVDNGIDTPVIGVALDGTGMGTDKHIWGGEFLVADFRNFTRAGHLQYLPLPGGDAAIKRPCRIAVGYVARLLGEKALEGLSFMQQVSETEAEIVKRQVEKGLNSPLTSSMGRLFDAVSALIGIRAEIGYEGQAAVELEMATYGNHVEEIQSYPFYIIHEDGTRTVQVEPLLASVIEDLKRGVSQGEISLKFHETIAEMVNEMCCLIASETGVGRVALSGGVFQNRLLLRRSVEMLEENGFQVFTHSQVPCNDGGISLGQAVIANFGG
ncbi:MAG: carbamoyltransferase HypF [Dehalococcoidia bacterium]